MLSPKIYIFLLCTLALAACSGDEDITLPEQQTQYEQFLSSSHSPSLVTEQEAAESIDNPEFYTTVGQTAYRYIRDYYNEARQTRTEIQPGDRVTLTCWVYVFDGSPIIDPIAASPAIAATQAAVKTAEAAVMAAETALAAAQATEDADAIVAADATLKSAQADLATAQAALDSALELTLFLYANDATLAGSLASIGLDARYWSFEPMNVQVGHGDVLKGVDLSLPGCRLGDVVEVYMTYTMAYGSAQVGVVPKHTPIVFFFRIESVNNE